MLVSSPRTWGCFLRVPAGLRRQRVFPTHVGVFLSVDAGEGEPGSLPHARGGVSVKERIGSSVLMSSPRTWGCFWCTTPAIYPSAVFPTHVGVFLTTPGGMITYDSLPHARGGVSISEWPNDAAVWSSPRTWGCFWNPRRAVSALAFVLSSPCTWGVSCEGSTSIGVLESSLHMWDLAISGILVLE
ncbi:Domain of uncharacterised function (DUF2825) [Klebsiella pneumoniae]|nr:Domain of uncharacterised function (DUF2825) [Klebsiella pneumoniae]SYK50025.1 Domain of uncharacterised function (DUF2825) [Klebsiella pneumoniae]VAS97476.1 Domain of uncharacterised function (DUF2825) [Klebsiella pneumoniae]